MEDEFGQEMMTEYVGLTPKVYPYGRDKKVLMNV